MGRQQIANLPAIKEPDCNPAERKLEKKEGKRNFTRNKNRTDYGKQRRNHPVPARQRSET